MHHLAQAHFDGGYGLSKVLISDLSVCCSLSFIS